LMIVLLRVDDCYDYTRVMLLSGVNE